MIQELRLKILLTFVGTTLYDSLLPIKGFV